MKKICVILLSTIIFGAAANAVAQPQKDTLSYAEHEIRKNLSIYQIAKRFNDAEVARMALYQMLIYTGNQGAILDSLALTYYGEQDYISAALVAKDAVASSPTDQLALEVAALSMNALGVKDQSLTYYEKLFLKNDQTSTLYQMAFLQYELKRFKESSASIGILMNRKDVDEQNILFNKVDQTQQQISMRAALTNLKGLIAQSEGRKEDAQNLYLEAIKLAPGFELAQANLKKLNE